MCLEKYRHSRIFRITAFLILLNFLTSQNLYGQEYAIQEGTHRYTPVLEVGGGPLPSEEWEREVKMFSKVFVAETPQSCSVNATKPDFSRNRS